MTRKVPTALRIDAVSKTYPGVRALQGVSLEVSAGEVHAIVGENGAGKSTLIKLVAGVERPDQGRVEIFGSSVEAGDPRAAADAGVATIYQELTMVPQMSAAANVFLGRLPSSRGVVSRRRMREEFGALAKRLDVDIDPNSPAGALPVANQQILEIMRALAADRRILIMDEPSASLGQHEREVLHRVVRDLRSSGHSIVFISHELDEVLALSDRVSVMREGSLIATRPAGVWTKDSLVEAMLGERTFASLARSSEDAQRRGPSGEDEAALRIEGVTIPGVLHDVGLTLRRGEILGIGGLVGSGRTELLRALAGADPPGSGRIWVDDTEVMWPRTVRAALQHGIALAPEDRKQDGLVLGMSAARNIVLTDLGSVAYGGVLRVGARRDAAATSSRPVGFDAARLGAAASTLSGGNQQKVVVAKWLHRRPRVLLLDEPTRGIDIGAKAEMYHFLRRLADDGMSLIVVSSELEEVVELSDRVYVMAGGRGIATLSAEEASVERILGLVFALEHELEVAA